MGIFHTFCLNCFTEHLPRVRDPIVEARQTDRRGPSTFTDTEKIMQSPKRLSPLERIRQYERKMEGMGRIEGQSHDLMREVLGSLIEHNYKLYHRRKAGNY